MGYSDLYRIGGRNAWPPVNVFTKMPAPTSEGAIAEEHVIVTDLDELQVTELTPIEEALALIDEGLGGLTERQLVSASEVADLLLDVRMLLSDSASSGSPAA